jgi:hypothetical protein
MCHLKYLLLGQVAAHPLYIHVQEPCRGSCTAISSQDH